MRTKTNTLISLMFFLTVFCISCFADSTSDQFQSMVRQLQQNPNDNALREKIIKLVQTMNPAPVISEDARRHEVIGTTLFKDAKTPDDYLQVTAEFKQATDLAPQWREARYNLALVKEAAGDYSGAMVDIKLYQMFKLPGEEARTAQDKIYVLEAKVAEAARRERDAESAAKTTRNKWDGAKWRLTYDGGHSEIECSGNTVIFYNTFTRNPTEGMGANYNANYQFGSRYKEEDSVTYDENGVFFHQGGCLRGEISHDGKTITETGLNSCTGEPPRTFIRYQ